MTPEEVATLRRKAKTAARAVDRTGRSVEDAFIHGDNKARERAVKAYYAALDGQDAISAKMKTINPDEDEP